MLQREPVQSSVADGVERWRKKLGSSLFDLARLGRISEDVSGHVHFRVAVRKLVRGKQILRRIEDIGNADETRPVIALLPLAFRGKTVHRVGKRVASKRAGFGQK